MVGNERASMGWRYLLTLRFRAPEKWLTIVGDLEYYILRGA
jgi:hypothetical protein